MSASIPIDSLVQRSNASSRSDRFITSEGIQDLLERVKRLSAGGGEISIWTRSRSVGYVRWARNAITTAGETTDHEIRITRTIRGASGRAATNQIDGDALRDCVRRAEDEAKLRREQRVPEERSLRMERYDLTRLWSDDTANLSAERRAEVQHQLAELPVAAKLISAGYLEVSAGGNGRIRTEGRSVYAPVTRAEYSITVRNAKGTGAGWAGIDNLDWAKIDARRLSEIAVDKCQRSADPVAIEPGRYTTILEPQAVAGLMFPLIESLYDRIRAERGAGPWANGAISLQQRRAQLFPSLADARARGGNDVLTKISQKVLDERVTIGIDPADPDMPIVPFDYNGDPIRTTRWIDQGVLRALPYQRHYALEALNKTDPLVFTTAFRMAGGESSVDEMVTSVTRGLLVTRFVNVRLIDEVSLLCTGITSDGLWLIERGKITKAVKNFRFRESPLFAFNNLVTLGEARRVLMPRPAIVPSALVRDFSMNSLNDSI